MSGSFKGAPPRPILSLPTDHPSTRRTDAGTASKLYGKTAPAPADSSHSLDDLTRFPGTDALGALSLTPLDDVPTLGGLDQFGAFNTLGNLDALGALGSDVDPMPTAALPTGRELAAGYRRFKVARDRDRPLEFDGRVRAQLDELSHASQVLLRAAIYETRGGKFVTEMTRREVHPPVDYGTGKRPFLFAKAAIFDNLDLAAMSFRTSGGRLTERLLAQIGDVDSEFIE